MPFLAFTAFSGATAQCQQLELLVLLLQHCQALHREGKELWELAGLGIKGDVSTWAILGLQHPKICCWDVPSKPPELAPPAGVQHWPRSSWKFLLILCGIKAPGRKSVFLKKSNKIRKTRNSRLVPAGTDTQHQLQPSGSGGWNPFSPSLPKPFTPVWPPWFGKTKHQIGEKVLRVNNKAHWLSNAILVGFFIF